MQENLAREADRQSEAPDIHSRPFFLLSSPAFLLSSPAKAAIQLGQNGCLVLDAPLPAGHGGWG
jgi:hypothetical protein